MHLWTFLFDGRMRIFATTHETMPAASLGSVQAPMPDNRARDAMGPPARRSTGLAVPARRTVSKQ